MGVTVLVGKLCGISRQSSTPIISVRWFIHVLFGRLFDVWSLSGRDKMVEKSAISAALRRRLFIVQMDVPRKFSKTIPRLKVQKVRKICYGCLTRRLWDVRATEHVRPKRCLNSKNNHPAYHPLTVPGTYVPDRSRENVKENKDPGGQ